MFVAGVLRPAGQAVGSVVAEGMKEAFDVMKKQLEETMEAEMQKLFASFKQ